MRHSLIVKLMGAFFLLIIICALIIFTATTKATKQAFVRYSDNNRQTWTQRLAENLADYYQSNGSWQGIDEVLTSEFTRGNHNSGMMMGKGKNGRTGFPIVMGGMMESTQRLILSDANSNVLFDSAAELTGKKLPDTELQSGTPISLENQQVGTILVSSESMRSGTPAAEFINSVNHSIILSILAGAIISIILGAVLFNQFTSPLRQLKKAAVEVGNGNFHQRVTIKSHDEFAEVAHSFNQMTESLEKAEESRLHYMADIAHELRTPLTAIQGTIEAMQDRILPLDDEQLEILHNQTTILNRLVNDLRLLSLAETGHLKLDKISLSPSEFIQKTVDSLKPLAIPKNITLKTNLPIGLPDWSLDPDRFTQILNNLLSNAIRYTPENGEIIVDAVYHPAHNELEISVTDSGIGISSEDLPYIFDRFYRVDKSRTRLSGGAGLGLAIVKRLVEAHGGKITVESPVFPGINKPDYGSRFKILLFSK